MSLEVKNLVKKYGEKTVVNDLSFKMEEPGVYALLGTNGAGKTTTIRIILGMLSYDSGQVLWNGKDIDPMSINLGYLAEERGLYPKFTLMDQLLYFAKLKNVPKALAKERIKYWAERLEVAEYLYQPVQPKKKAAFGKKKDKPKTADQLSKGNQQKIQLITALAHDPDIIILDEPFSGLDPVNAMMLKDVVREQLQKGKIVLFSSHQMSYIEEFCDSIAILADGRVSLTGDLNEIKRNYPRNKLSVRSEDIEEIKKDFGSQSCTDENGELLITLENEAEKTSVMRRLTENYDIDAVKVFEPSLNDIFVEHAGEAQKEERL